MFKNRPPRIRNSAWYAFVPLCLFLITAQLASAQNQEDRRYDVELLIFKYSNPEEFASENWPPRWSLPETKNSIDPEDMTAGYKSDFEVLAPTAKSFGGILEKLEKSTHYKVLHHAAWRQRGLDKEQAISVRIRAGRRYLPQAPIPADSKFGLFEQSFIEQDFLPEVTVRRYAETQSKTGPVLHELEGTVKVVLSRFLHVYTDLLLLEPVTLTPAAESAGRRNAGSGSGHNPASAYQIAWVQAPAPLGSNNSESPDASETLYGFNIKAHRRMRSGELHHLDHPLLGMLIQIKPVEAPKP